MKMDKKGHNYIVKINQHSNLHKDLIIYKLGVLIIII